MIDLSGIDADLHEGLRALAGDMRVHGYQRDDPVREIFGLLGDRWTTLILLVLRIGTFRHAELRRALGRLGAEGKISQRVLTLKLRTLERNGLVTRHITADVPPRVSYALTDMGLNLVSETRHLIAWVHKHQTRISETRMQFDHQEGDA